MTERRAHISEVAAILSDDERLCIAIIKREDDLFSYAVDMLQHDDETGAHYWSTLSNSPSGIYETALEAEREARSQCVRWREISD